MIRELRIYLAIRGPVQQLFQQLEGLQMKFSTNSLIQVIGTAGNIMNQVSGFVPEDKKWIVATVLSILQLSAGVAAHFSNPDGTSVKTAYTPAK